VFEHGAIGWHAAFGGTFLVDERGRIIVRVAGGVLVVGTMS
jgi:hypothetical protein